MKDVNLTPSKTLLDFFGSLGLVFNGLPRTYRHKLSTSFAVMVGNEATVLQTSCDGLSLIASVANLFRLLLDVNIIFILVLRQERLIPFIGASVAKGVQVGVCKSIHIANNRLFFTFLGNKHLHHPWFRLKSYTFHFRDPIYAESMTHSMNFTGQNFNPN